MTSAIIWNYAYFPVVYGTAGLRGAHPVSGQAVLWHYNILTFVFQPPFVMEKWILGIMENQTVECTVTYEVSLGQGGMKGPMALPSVSW